MYYKKINNIKSSEAENSCTISLSIICYCITSHLNSQWLITISIYCVHHLATDRLDHTQLSNSSNWGWFHEYQWSAAIWSSCSASGGWLDITLRTTKLRPSSYKSALAHLHCTSTVCQERKRKCKVRLKLGLRNGPHSLGQSKSEGQCRFKLWRKRFHSLIRGSMKLYGQEEKKRIIIVIFINNVL